MNWLKAEFGFSDRLKIFCLGMRTALVHDIVNVLRDNQDKPEYIEAFAKGLLHLYRPELSDACVLHMSYDASMLSWRLLVSHGSFEPVPPGMLAPVERLIPDGTEFTHPLGEVAIVYPRDTNGSTT